jgi:hypothetical protein
MKNETKQTIKVCVCFLCMCVCGCARARVCVCVCARACLYCLYSCVKTLDGRRRGMGDEGQWLKTQGQAVGGGRGDYKKTENV